MSFWLTSNSNINPETGIRYGVTNNIPSWIYDESMSWECPAYNEAVQEIAAELMREMIKKDEILAEDLDGYAGHELLGGMSSEDLLEYVDDHFSEKEMLEFMEDNFDCELGSACEEIDDSESTKFGTYEDPDYPGQPLELMISYLGGAPLLWVLEGPVVMTSALCSPCVPGAVDCDYEEQRVEMSRLRYGDDEAVRSFNIWLRERFGMRRGSEDGYLGYCVPESWLEDEA
jgi:hypothetical protein